MRWKEDQGDSGCSSLGLLRRKVARIMMPFTHTLKSLIGHVILTFCAHAGCSCARTAFDASAADVDGQQPFRCRNLKPNGFLLVPSETHGSIATSILFPFLPYLACLKHVLFNQLTGQEHQLSLFFPVHPCVTCHAVTAPAVTPVTPSQASAHEHSDPSRRSRIESAICLSHHKNRSFTQSFGFYS
jgi:hypothetical protein